MFLLRFLLSVFFLSGLFFLPGIKAGACEMHHQTAATATDTKQATPKEADAPMDCCQKHAPKQHSNTEKGHCNHDDCTSNICHPMSVSSLHVEATIEIVAIPEGNLPYVIRSNDMQPFSYTYSIWQPPRLG